MSLTDDLVVGGCRLEAVIGRGGMGTVYRASQLALGRDVAVKVVPAQGVEPGVVERFQREARTAAALDHPHLVPIYAAGEEDGLLYLVMRLVDGADLGAAVGRDGPFAAQRSVAMIEQVASALDAIHAAGLVHRDVKPANVLIDRQTDRAYLSDYGLVRRALERSAITRTGEWVGTIDYAAPEQLQGAAVGPAADVYALGAVLYFALTGQRPFPRATVSETARAHATTPPPRIAAPQQLNPVIARAMAKAPRSRFESAGDLAAAARRAVGRSGGGGRSPGGSRSRSGGGRRTFAVAATAGLAAVAIGVALAVSLGGRGRPTVATAAAPAFTFSYPAGWHVAETGFPMGTFDRTEVVSGDGAEAVIIDRTPGEPLSLNAWATGVERDTAPTTGYRLVSLGAGTIHSRPATFWRFLIGSDPRPDRIDIFQLIGPDGYAVLGEGRSLARVAPIAIAVAGSLRPRS